LIVTHSDQLQSAKWGLIPFWVRDIEKAENLRKMTVNARSETAFTQPSFRDAIRKHRCLIPSTGYYEYHYEGKEAIPYRIFLHEPEIFSLAGIYDEWIHPKTKETIKTFSILTVPANELCGFIHNGGRNPGRMPAILPVEDEEKWLNPSLKEYELSALLQPYNSKLMEACAMEKDYLRRT
jgi:putative SOS response-associated peptidase YedK